MCVLDTVKEDKRNGRFFQSRELGDMENNECGSWFQGVELQFNQKYFLILEFGYFIQWDQFWINDYCYFLFVFF